jgi:hypothetical protein
MSNKIKTYYHATSIDNYISILSQGLLPRFGEIYCSDNENTALKWICFTRMWAEEIVVIPFTQNVDKMKVGSDHSPIMAQILGVKNEGASFTCNERIPPQQFVFDKINIYKNPFFSEDSRDLMHKM